MALVLIRPANKAAIRLYKDKPVPGVSTIEHNGNDYPWGNGKQIYAAASGRVSLIRWSASTRTNNRQGGYGNYLILDHGNGYSTLYAHLPATAMLVSLGQEVKQGDLIAWMGDTGNAAGVHLHFEVRYRGSIVDPNQFFGSSTASGTTKPLEPQLTPEQARMLTAIYDAIFNGGPSMQDGAKSVSQSLAEISATVNKNVLRDTDGDGANQEISQIQDNADTNSMVRQLLSRAPGSSAPLDYAAIGQAVRNAVFK